MEGKMLSSISCRLHLHNYGTGSWLLEHRYGRNDGILRDISWSDDGKYMLQVNAKGLVEVLCAVAEEVHCLQHIPVKDTWTATFHRDGHREIAIGTRSGNILIWDVKNKHIIKTFPHPTQQSSVEHLSFNAKNTSLAANTANGDTVIYGLNSNNSFLTVKLPYSRSISVMKFHHESKSLLGLATEEGHVILRDIASNEDRSLFENVHASNVSDFAYSLVNKDVFLSSGYDKVMNVYDIRLQNVVSKTQTSHILTSLAINIDNQVALGTKNGTVLLYDLRDLSNPFKTLKEHENEVSKVAFQPLRKKVHCTEISLHEDEDTIQTLSPVKSNRKSDESSNSEKSNADPNSNSILDEDCNISPPETGKKNDFDKKKYLIAGRDTFQISTPLQSNNNIEDVDIDQLSPICVENDIETPNSSSVHLHELNISNISSLPSNNLDD